ncbi:hypothetical protein AB0L97_27070 [Nocardia sp. NPDC051911]|uniref:hypothetical protein n=1 Tax=Nocardia sp. NPDC051911 TaxID=3154648 RepID=UPI00343908FC
MNDLERGLIECVYRPCPVPDRIDGRTRRELGRRILSFGAFAPYLIADPHVTQCIRLVDGSIASSEIRWTQGTAISSAASAESWELDHHVHYELTGGGRRLRKALDTPPAETDTGGIQPAEADS